MASAVTAGLNGWFGAKMLGVPRAGNAGFGGVYGSVVPGYSFPSRMAPAPNTPAPSRARRGPPPAIVALTTLLLLWGPCVRADDFFEARIRPLLVDRCQGCHSSGAGAKREGGLALDSRAGWQAGGDSGQAIRAGDAAGSLLLRAVRRTAGVSAMPPEDAGPPLTPDQVAALEAWIRAGAVDPRDGTAMIGGMDREAARRWWSFQPPRAAAPPEVSDPTLAEDGIDRFIVAALEERGLAPAAMADKPTLLRRATLDLTGLPPTAEEIEAFLADDSSDAWSRVVERLLESPAYGERWGRHWLDVARYADTAGDGADYPVREAGGYRDWVIRAFRDDLPYDEFLRRQIAGDILARDASPAEMPGLVTATGFLAIGKRYGYAPNPDFRHLDFADVIDSLGRSVLGLSLGCARCHDHKYDPVTGADYYALYGILESTVWSFPGGEEHKRPANFPPLVPPAEAARLDAEKATALAALDRRLGELRSQRLELEGKAFAGGSDLDLEAQEPGRGPEIKPWLSAGPNVVGPESQSPFRHVHPAGTRGVRVGTGKPNDGVRHTFEQRLVAGPGAPIRVAFDFRTVPADGAEQPAGACRFYVGRGVIESTAIDFSATVREFAVRDASGWRVVTAIEPGRWHHVEVTLDRAAGEARGTITPAPDEGAAAEPIALGSIALPPAWDGVVDTFINDGLGHVAGPATVRDLDNLARRHDPLPAPGSPAVVKAPPPADAAARIPELAATIDAVEAERKAVAARAAYAVAYGVSEGKPADARIQLRGEPDKPGAAVPRRNLEILGGDAVVDPSGGSGRLDLAAWLTRRENPLTARVFVNRVWQWHFGRGLVATPSDFGTRGEAPSHPELLDWLAVRFMEGGWRVKDLHRLVLHSRTFRQSAHGSSDAIAADPENRLLARFPHRALDAETLRDAILATSGLLDRSAAPPHPFPPVETWAFTIHQPFHAVHDSDRRSIYLMVQRNRRHPFLALFDAADPNQSIAARDATITPTQSLFLMNSPLVHRAGEAFATRILDSGSDTETRLRAATIRAWGREATAAELAGMRDFLAAAGTTDAAAWQALARVLLTSNPFLFVE